jgi:hypothetical protein
MLSGLGLTVEVGVRPIGWVGHAATRWAATLAAHKGRASWAGWVSVQ